MDFDLGASILRNQHNYRLRSIYAPVSVVMLVLLWGCRASPPGKAESAIAERYKELAIGGKNVPNPLPDNDQNIHAGAEHFQHHCQICHGLDGQNTGVPFAGSMSPPVANLASKEIQDYTDGQLQWIIANGIRFTGMPAWKDILTTDEMWQMVRYLRHLPPKGSLGTPKIYQETGEAHEHSHTSP